MPLKATGSPTSNRILSDIQPIISFFEEYHALQLDYMNTDTMIRRIYMIFEKFHISSVDQFFSYMKNDHHFSEQVIRLLYPSETELFRDPTFWALISKKINHLINKNKTTDIAFLDITSGEELYSLIIAMQEHNLLKNISVAAYSPASAIKKFIMSGLITSTRLDHHNENYKLSGGKSSISNYFEPVGKQWIFNNEMLYNIKYDQKYPVEFNTLDKYDILFFRNRLMHYNYNTAKEIILKLAQSQETGSILILGTHENMLFYNQKHFKAINAEEGIYERTRIN